MGSMFSFLQRIYLLDHPPKCDKSANPVRIGILGAAAIAPEALIIPTYSHPEAAVYAVAARDLNRAKQFAKKYGIEKAYGGPNGYQELLEDPRIDAIYNPLPNALHYEWTMKALAAGKHVLLEKPTADRAPETQEMFEFAKKNDLVLLEAFHYRFHPAVLRIKEILDSGELGPIKSIDANMRLPKGFVADDDIRFIYKLGGGSMSDMGCYTMNTLRYFASSEPTAVLDATAERLPVDNGSEYVDLIDVGMKATLAFPNDIIGTLTCHHRVLPGPLRLWTIPIIPEIGLNIVCENGELQAFNHIKPATYHWLKVSVKAGKQGKVRNSRYEKVYTLNNGARGEAWWQSYRYQLEAFVDKVKGREPHAWISAEDSISNMEWVEKVYEKSGLGPRPASTFKLSTQ